MWLYLHEVIWLYSHEADECTCRRPCESLLTNPHPLMPYREVLGIVLDQCIVSRSYTIFSYIHTYIAYIGGLYISSSVFIGHSPVDRSYTCCLNYWLISHHSFWCAGSPGLNIMCAQHMSRLSVLHSPLSTHFNRPPTINRQHCSTCDRPQHARCPAMSTSDTTKHSTISCLLSCHRCQADGTGAI